MCYVRFFKSLKYSYVNVIIRINVILDLEVVFVKKTIKDYIQITVLLATIVIMLTACGGKQQKALDEFPKAEVNAIAQTYGVNDFTYYTVKAVSGEFAVRIKSEEFGSLSDEDKFRLLYELDEKGYYSQWHEIVSVGDEYWIDRYDYELFKNSEVVYTKPGENDSDSGSSARITCSSCGGSGKKLVTWYEYGDWGEKSYSSYDCTKCGGKGYIYG